MLKKECDAAFIVVQEDRLDNQVNISYVDLPVEHNVERAPARDQIRLCSVKKWSDYDGYGFNLHNEKGRPGHFVGSVEPHSPAAAAGLLEGDQIFEVNNGSVRSDDHNTVIQRIKMRPDEVTLLVATPAVGAQYINQDIWPHSRMSNIQTNIGPDAPPTVITSEVNTSIGKMTWKWSTLEEGKIYVEIIILDLVCVLVQQLIHLAPCNDTNRDLERKPKKDALKPFLVQNLPTAVICGY